MVDRDVFDEWLRERAADAGAVWRAGAFQRLDRRSDHTVEITYAPKGNAGRAAHARARAVIGADGALSAVARQSIPEAREMPYVYAYHEIVRRPPIDDANYSGERCDVFYKGALSPDFYAWIFPHGDTASVGTGTAHKGFGLRQAVTDLRKETGLDRSETIRREGAPIPLKPLKRWDDGRNVLLAGDAAGVVAPASGEGIYYAMVGGRLAADGIDAFLRTNDARTLASARRRFMRAHGRVFWILGMMQWFWYATDPRRERFVSICRDPDVQRLTWNSYLNKELTWESPSAHARIFFKDLAHLVGLVRP